MAERRIAERTGRGMLVAQRRRLLEELGVIHQRPYLESTPRYTTGAAFRDLGLDPAALEVFSTASKAESDLGLLHDPPYQHQAISTKLSLVDGRSLVVITGTGSGKTECFLLPILGRLAREARTNGQEFGSTPAVRAMVLYPMNALVNDQLGRLRLLFGNPRIVKKFMEWSGRPARFARYTSRTLYPGVRDEKKDQHRLLPIGNYYVRNLELAQDSASPQQATADALVSELKRRGKWPAKPDLIGWYGKKGSRWRDAKSGDFKRCVTLPGDPELVTRQGPEDCRTVPLRTLSGDGSPRTRRRRHPPPATAPLAIRPAGSTTRTRCTGDARSRSRRRLEARRDQLKSVPNRTPTAPLRHRRCITSPGSIRMRYHQPTVDYVARRTADGRTKREIIRCLKRFLAREIYQRVMTDFRARQEIIQAA